MNYLLTDRLGSTALTVDSNGTKIAELRYREASRSAAEWTNPAPYGDAARGRNAIYLGQHSHRLSRSIPVAKRRGHLHRSTQRDGLDWSDVLSRSIP